MSTFDKFKWKPDLGALPTRTPIVSVVSFGDGYELRVGESLNRVKSSWDLTFTRPADEIVEIDEFLTSKAGVEAFSWETPIKNKNGYVTGVFVCREWQGPAQTEPVLYTLTDKFEQVFES